ncbi:MAG: hypothetical protein EZS28_045305, partial [Streblomastix strix]
MTQKEFPIKVGEVINGTYTLVRKLSQGKRCTIFCATDQQLRQVVIKLEKDTEGQISVCIEGAIIKIIGDTNRFPKIFQYGSYKNYKFLAMELMGPNLIDLVNYNKHGKFSLHSVLKFGIQAIKSIQIVHNKGFIHRDIKP